VSNILPRAAGTRTFQFEYEDTTLPRKQNNKIIATAAAPATRTINFTRNLEKLLFMLSCSHKFMMHQYQRSLILELIDLLLELRDFHLQYSVLLRQLGRKLRKPHNREGYYNCYCDEKNKEKHLTEIKNNGARKNL